MSKWGLLLQISNQPNEYTHGLFEAVNLHCIECVPHMVDIAPTNFGKCIGQDEFTMKSSLSDKRAEWKNRCSCESVMRLLREFYEFIAAKMPRELPQYL